MARNFSTSSGVLASPSAAKQPSPTSKMFILHIHPTVAGANLPGKLIPSSPLHVLPPSQSHAVAPPWERTPDNQLSLHSATPCHLAPDGPTQGARASVCNLSLSTLMGCRTRLASNTCFEYLQTVPEERSLLPSVLLGANPGSIWEKNKEHGACSCPQIPPTQASDRHLC